MREPRYKFSMRFKDRRTEAYFVESQSQELLNGVYYLSLVCAPAALSFLIIAGLLEAPDPHAPGVDRVRLLRVVSSAACLVVALLAGIAAKMQRVNRYVSPETREVVAVLVMMLFSFMTFLIDVFYCTRFLGYDPEVIWPLSVAPHSDTRPVLVLSLLMALGHLTLPIRWSILLPLEGFSIIVYSAFAFIVGGPDGPRAWHTLLLYTGLVLSSAIGRRTIEHHQREALSQLITERSLRAETEFKLTQMEQISQPPDARHSHEDQTSMRESRPETTVSAQAFMSASETGDLQRITEIGRHEQWLIDPGELDLLPEQVMGTGGFGVVVSGSYCGTSVAIKMMQQDRDQTCQRKHWLGSILNEIRVLRRLRHPNVVSFYGVCRHGQDDNVLLILEWVHGPCLESFVLAGGVPDRPLVMTDQANAILDTCHAVCYLHTRQPSIVHGDLKGTNIILERDPGRPDSFRAKLLDFGLARVLTRHIGCMGGTVMWMAPEVAQNPDLPANTCADVFSFGRLSFFVLTGIFPYGRCGSKEEILEILRSGSLPPLPWPIMSSRLIADCRPWIEACAAYDNRMRPSMELVKLHLSETVDRLGLKAATQGQRLPRAAQQDETDSRGAAASGSRNDVLHAAPEAFQVAPDSSALADSSHGLATVLGL